MYNRNKTIIIDWYHKHNRVLPWRQTKDAYYIWLSEIILQQTRVQQGLPYYNKFIKAYPSISKFAQAQESEILLLWQGLGYYSRARNMHATAKYIVKNHQGVFPSNYQEIRNLKGVGDYTAAAIASFAFDLPYPAVDGNVMRVIARLYGIEDDIASAKTRKAFTAIAQEMMGTSSPALFNQSMMEFGALQCSPKKPDCSSCPIQEQCVAYATNRVQELPVKLKKVKVRNRYFNYLIIKNSENSIYIKQRTGKGIWQNLYEFPLIESSKSLNEAELLIEIHNQYTCESPIELKFRSLEIKHKLSHQLLHIHFNILSLNKLIPNCQWYEISPSHLSNYAFPEVINKNKKLLLKQL